jgi:hypothetical protein
MSKNISNTTLLKWFVKEELRVFETLFGNKRLALFPVMLFILSLILGISLPAFDVGSETMSAVLVAMVGLFGLQTGSIGFEARDTISDLMGDTSRILFSSRNLPINKKRLAAIFLVKDAFIYSIFMLLPIFIGVIIGVSISPIDNSIIVPSYIDIIASYLLVVLSFIFGASAGFVLTTFESSKLKGIFGIFVSIITVIPIFYFSYYNPEFFVQLSYLQTYLALTFGTVFLTLIGLWQFEMATNAKTESRHSNIFKKITSKIKDTPENQIFVKTIIDVIRSPGGLWKIVFSTGVVSLTVVFLVTVVKQFMYTGTDPSFLYSSLFALSVFPVYTLVYRYDSNSSYSYYPLTEYQVKKAKSAVYVLISTIVVGSYYTVASTALNVSIVDYLIGLLVMICLITYQMGVFLLVAKDEPLKFLFNGVMFSGYSFSLLIVMIPLTMVGLFGSVLPTSVTYFGITVCMICLVFGVLLARTSLKRNWS